jgi:hypothetical protein
MRRNHASGVPADQALCSALPVCPRSCLRGLHLGLAPLPCSRRGRGAEGQRGRCRRAEPHSAYGRYGAHPSPSVCTLPRSAWLPTSQPASPQACTATTAGTTPPQRLCAALRVPPLFLGLWLGVQPHDTPDMASPTRYLVATSLPLRRSKFADSRTSAMGGSPFSSEMIPPRLPHLTEEIMFVSGGRNYRVVAELGLQWAPCQ